MDISYDEIRRIYRLEKSTSKLVDVSDDFYNSLNDFVKVQRDAYLKSLKDFSLEEARDFANLKKMVEEIFGLREKKILSRALLATRTGEDSIEGMALQEKKMFHEVLLILKKQRSLLEEIFSANSEHGEKPQRGGEAAKGLNTLSVKILKEVPAFIGTDMKEYGSFSKDQVVELPFKIARLFVEKNMAEAVEK